ncbi:hypothetical protein [Nostoc sp. CALU 546]|uniref:hypothetical protein n=1 Tax=Nostoc sp. CALU 546 TaxID=1867241 RepID=UPI003B676896
MPSAGVSRSLPEIEKIRSSVIYQKVIPMNIENVSPQMQRRFKILDEMLKKGYIKPIKPLFDFLPSLCFDAEKTSEFNNAPQELKKEFNQNMFSWYAFWLGIFAFTQTKLEKDYLIYFSSFIVIISLLPPNPFDTGLGLGASIFLSRAFVFSRYYQYKNYGRCPSNRNTFSAIFISLIYFCILVIVSAIIQTILYPADTN